VLSAILRQDFGLEARNISLPDDAEVVSQTLEELAGSCDLILSSGGVSMGGEFDVVKVALDGFGVEFWQVSIKPAKPLGFGRIGEAVFFGLPGNPVSSIVSFELFVRPALRRMLGLDPAVPPTVRMVAGEPLKRGDDGKVHFARVALGADGRVRSAGGQGSHIMSGLAAADALAVLGPDTLEVAEGEELDAIPLRGVR
jgi:molybdopterin molybdotransferase